MKNNVESKSKPETASKRIKLLTKTNLSFKGSKKTRKEPPPEPKTTNTTPLDKSSKRPSTPSGGNQYAEPTSKKKTTGSTTPMEKSSKRKQQKKKNGEKSIKGKNSKIMSKYQFKVGEEVEGVNVYKIEKQVRKTTRTQGPDIYIIKDPETDEICRFKAGVLDYGILKKEAAILKRLARVPGDKYFPNLVEYGTVPAKRIEFVIVSPFGITLDDMMKKVLSGPFTPDCAFNIGLQMLKAIKDLHSVGYLHRNISPVSFNVGLGENEKSVLLTDFRAHRKWQENNKSHAPARPKVKKYGSTRFASRACLSEKDQGRKDDLESWVYTLFYLIDPFSLSWKKETDIEKVVKLKEIFMKNEGKETFAKIPEDMKKVVSVLAWLKYEDEPDYEAISSKMTEIQKDQKFEPAACDWKDKKDIDGVYEGETAKTIDNRLSGEGDVAVVEKKEKKVKGQRKKLSTGDVIRTQGKNCWKVVSLLGSGGFGDVYKVSKDGGPIDKCYALKTEGEDGEKRLLRLKVEVAVMMKTSEGRDTKKFEHFIEFVDRGKCDELKCKFVVMGLVGPSLEDIRRKYILAQFSKSTCFNVAIQTVDAVRDLHSLGYLHRDIKPANYAVGLNEWESVVYMLDFGIAKLYRNPDGTHKTPRKKVKFLGTLRYASRACMRQVEQGRKDDLECWIFMVIDLFDENAIPWRRIPDPRKILASKDKFFLCENPQISKRIPTSFSILVKYIAALEYESAPDYEYIPAFLRQLAKDNHIKPDKKLDWIGKLKKKAFDSESEKSEKNKKQTDDESE